jgi:hypothetical protein
VKDNVIWEAGPGTAEGRTTATEAEKVCDATINCIAFNSKGDYIFGNASSVNFEPYDGLCVYVKDPGKATLQMGHKVTKC